MKIDKRRNITTRLAYIAGFIDGEGCVRIKKSNQSGNSYYITLHVTNTDRYPLEVIKSIFGGKVYEQERGINKTVWQYYSASNDAVDMCRTLLGFCLSKREQMELAITFHDNMDTLSSKDKQILYKKMRELKKRPSEIIGNIYENPELIENTKKD